MEHGRIDKTASNGSRPGTAPACGAAPHGNLPGRCRPPLASSTHGEARAHDGPSVGPCHVARRHRKIDPTLHGAGDVHPVLRRMEGNPPDLSGIGVVPDAIEGGFGDRHPGPRMTVAQNTLVAGNHGPDRRRRHPRPQAKRRPDAPRGLPVQDRLLAAARGSDALGDRDASWTPGLDAWPEPFSRLRGRIQWE